MSEQISSEIENVMLELYNMEKELDEIKAKAEEMNKRLLSLAQEEAERAKIKSLEEATKKAEEEINSVKVGVEKEAEIIVAKSKEKVGELRAKIKKVYDKAIDIVVKTILGE
ncbi:MAG: hypothetical protein H3Z53_02720 [archaeon]|nr:hypothetical protein [archaeon]MCP8313274.1 hypothetical protein [archaeon]MCP8319479.1 hypothetical protein [archaeon]